VPVHKVPAASLHEDLIDIQRQGEIIETVVQQSRSYFVVVTRKPDLIETRPSSSMSDAEMRRLRALTHAERVGAQETRAKWDDPLLESFYTDNIVAGDA
jgi:hypothetical protein